MTESEPTLEGPRPEAVESQADRRAVVLIVDDEPVNRALVRISIGGRYDLLDASNGLEALSILRATPVDLVLLDVRMPEMSGFDVCRQIKAAHTDPYLPVILLTALGEQGERNAGLEAGADDFLTKPVDRRELLLRMQTFIRLRKQDERIRRQIHELTERDRVIRRQVEELQELAVQRQRVAEQLKMANDELEAFSYSVSHDLRAPLRAIGGFSDILLTEHAASLNDECLGHLGRIRTATARMGVLIEALLELGRVSKERLRRQPIDLTRLARQVFEELRRREPNRHVDLELQGDLRASGDPSLMGIVLDNLLRNAWKFTGGRERARISVGRVLVQEQMAFFVRDNGAGFDPAFGEKLFRPFQRLHSASQFEGTGIGLATVFRIISRHGGRIWAEGAVDQGASFFFTVGDDSDAR